MPLGLLLLALVLSANTQDRDGSRQLLTAFFGQTARRRAKHIWADGGYAGALVAWARQLWRCTRFDYCRGAGWWSAPSADWGATTD